MNPQFMLNSLINSFTIDSSSIVLLIIIISFLLYKDQNFMQRKKESLTELKEKDC